MQKKLQSLVSLLEETDEKIYTQVYEELMRIAVNSPAEYLEFLQTHSNARETLEEIWQQTYAEELARWRKQEFGKDLLKGWFLISRLLKDPIDARKVYNNVNRLANLFWINFQTLRNSQEKIRKLYELLQNEHFQIDEQCAVSFLPDCILLQKVFYEKIIGGLSFVMLFHILLKKTNIDSHIIKPFPYTFALRLRSNKEEFYVLPYKENFIVSPTLKNMSVGALEKLRKAKPYSHIYVILEIMEELIRHFSILKGEERKLAYWQKVKKIIEVKRK